jgi:hypothetical protein
VPSPLASLPAPLALVAHDAGAANHLYAWLRMAPLPGLRLCLGGPALARCPAGHAVLPLEEALAGAAFVVSGTGWASDLEHQARVRARALGLPSVAVIDHWTNYEARFIRDGVAVLPDEIWVTDPYALAQARATFPGVTVREQPNAYLEGEADAVRDAMRRQPPPPGPLRVLYVLEPIRDAWGALAQPGEFAALDYFMAHRDALGIDGDSEIVLRPHPSDPPGKYDAWVAAQGHAGLRVAADGGLADALAWADLVVGCQTYAMVVALAAGRRVVSSVPSWAPPCVLPHAGIVRLSEL